MLLCTDAPKVFIAIKEFYYVAKLFILRPNNWINPVIQYRTTVVYKADSIDLLLSLCHISQTKTLTKKAERDGESEA